MARNHWTGRKEARAVSDTDFAADHSAGSAPLDANFQRWEGRTSKGTSDEYCSMLGCDDRGPLRVDCGLLSSDDIGIAPKGCE